ncbi:MAG: hypothetical protein ISR65_14925 [Bacteriovoracaceae bacterium]|nr:hypothetical protein [Bacteriovoracaceae bacterium]
MKVLILISLLIKLSPVSATLDIPQWKHYPYKEAGSDIIFPKDEGKHSGISNLEWWYAVMHVTGEVSKNRYAILVTHFNNNLRFFTVTNLSDKTHISATALGILSSKKERLDLVHRTKYGKDYFRNKKNAQGKLIPFEYELKTNHKSTKLVASLEALRPPLFVQGSGYVAVGSSGHSWYYSLTRLKASGTLTYKGKSESFTGMAWIDHQWGPFKVSPFDRGRKEETYEWFCVQLDDGPDIMISNIYDKQYNLPVDLAYGTVEMMDKNGNSYSTLDRQFTRTNFYKAPQSNKFISMGWELEVPEWNLHLILTPNMKDQMVELPFNGSFWEGSISVSGTMNNNPVKGQAFGELIHRFEIPKIEISNLKDIYESSQQINFAWKILNPDAGNPLTYDIELILESNKRYVIKKGLKSNKFGFKLADVVFSDELNRLKKFYIKITAYSVDQVISGNITSKQLLKGGG